MSIKSEILDIARDHGYKGNAQTIRGAINALADTLAGEDAHDGKTIASAIRALSPYIGEVPSGTISINENGTDIDVSSYAKADVAVPNPSTGTLSITENGENIDVTEYAAVDVAVSGGASVGDLVSIWLWTSMSENPAVGGELGLADNAYETLAIGNKAVASAPDNNGAQLGGVAAGVTVTTMWMPAFGNADTDAIYGYVATVDANHQITAISAWDGTITKEDGTGDYAGNKRYTYTVPALEAGQSLVLQYIANWD